MSMPQFLLCNIISALSITTRSHVPTIDVYQKTNYHILLFMNLLLCFIRCVISCNFMQGNCISLKRYFCATNLTRQPLTVIKQVSPNSLISRVNVTGHGTQILSPHINLRFKNYFNILIASSATTNLLRHVTRHVSMPHFPLCNIISVLLITTRRHVPTRDIYLNAISHMIRLGACSPSVISQPGEDVQRGSFTLKNIRAWPSFCKQGLSSM